MPRSSHRGWASEYNRVAALPMKAEARSNVCRHERFDLSLFGGDQTPPLGSALRNPYLRIRSIKCPLSELPSSNRVCAADSSYLAYGPRSKPERVRSRDISNCHHLWA